MLIVTQRLAATIVRGCGMSFSVTDGEIRIAPKDGTAQTREDRAYYTNDLGDAVYTAVCMRPTYRCILKLGHSGQHMPIDRARVLLGECGYNAQRSAL